MKNDVVRGFLTMQRLLLELEEEEDGAGVMGMVNPVTICDFAAILRDAHKFNCSQLLSGNRTIGFQSAFG